jgi:FkbM family methyltransferase
MLGYVARIVSFEPVPENFAVLAAHAHSDPDWYAHAFALGSAVGPAPFRVTEGSTFSSFNVPSAFGRAEFGAKLNMSHQIEVRVERLENVLNECCGPVAEKANIFLKCDTQGYDLEVVRGAGSAIDRILGLQVELPLKPIYRGLPSFTHSFEELRALGFELVGLYPVVRDAAYNVIEVDCLMQRVPTNTLRPPPD